MQAMQKRPAQILRDAANLLRPRGAWLQNNLADNPNLEIATCFCVIGAIAKAGGLNGYLIPSKFYCQPENVKVDFLPIYPATDALKLY